MTGDYGQTVEEPQGSPLFNHLPAILWQRRWFLVVPFLLMSAAGITAAYMLPTVYRSSATLLVESQELPADVVGTPSTSMIDQRIAKIRQQVLSRGNLIELIQQNNLYSEERQLEPLSTVIEKMRDSTSIEAVAADLGSNNTRNTTIAFGMMFDYHEPAPAQLVVQEYVRRVLDLDSSQMAEQAQSTVTFLSEQAADLQRQIAVIEGQITSIKAQNGTALASAGVSTIMNAGSFDAQIAALQRDNAQLARQTRTVVQDPLMAAAEAQLASARAVFSENHPDVAFARQRLEEAKRLARSDQRAERDALITSEIQTNNAQIAALGRARSMEMSQAAVARGAQARAPVVMEKVAQLDNRANALRAQLQEVSGQLLSARTAAKMEDEQKGERLSLIEAPVVPDRPTSPDRPKLIIGGIVAGAGAGLLLALLVELLLRPIRGVREIEQLVGSPPLVVVPTYGERDSLLQRLFFWRNRLRLAGGA